MKPLNQRAKRLVLHRESLRILSPSRLSRVVGGETKGCTLPKPDHTATDCDTLCLTNCDSGCIC